MLNRGSVRKFDQIVVDFESNAGLFQIDNDNDAVRITPTNNDSLYAFHCTAADSDVVTPFVAPRQR